MVEAESVGAAVAVTAEPEVAEPEVEAALDVVVGEATVAAEELKMVAAMPETSAAV